MAAEKHCANCADLRAELARVYAELEAAASPAPSGEIWGQPTRTFPWGDRSEEGR